MKDLFGTLIEKLNDILYEVLGLLLPTLVLCMVLIEPLFYMKDFSWKSIRINDYLKVLKGDNLFVLILFIIAFFYVVGNVIKVLAKLYYDLGKAIFDDTLLAILDCIYEKFFNNNPKDKQNLKNGEENDLNGGEQNQDNFSKLWKKPFFSIIGVLYKWLRNILVFKTERYGSGFEELYTELAGKVSITLENEKDKEEKWFLFYKKATTLIKQNNINTLYYKFLAKYNSFRSIEFAFFCGIIYNIFFRHFDIDLQRYFIVLGVNVVCLISFHEKFKRYWKLCGNEAIAGMDYFYRYMEGKK